MREIGTSGSMSGEGKRGHGKPDWGAAAKASATATGSVPPPRPSSTLLRAMRFSGTRHAEIQRFPQVPVVWRSRVPQEKPQIISLYGPSGVSGPARFFFGACLSLPKNLIICVNHYVIDKYVVYVKVISITIILNNTGRHCVKIEGRLPDQTRDVVPDGGQFLKGSYTNQAGTRTYKLYIPSGYRAQALPLVVMLHGCTQTPDDFAAGTRMNGLAEEHPCFVVYPAQASAANGSKCWNWFKATDQHRGQGEPSIIAGITRQIVSTYPVDARRVYVAGLSAGGAMAAIMGMAYPDLYAAIGIHSGLAYAVARDVPSALAAMQQGGAAPVRQRDDGALGANSCTRVVPTIVFHGDRDTTVHPRNGDQVIAQWATIHAGGGPHTEAGTNPQVTVQRAQVPDGHAYTRAIYHDASGQAIMEQWLVHGAGHAWSGGSPSGSFSDPKGPDAAQEMIRFFYEHPGLGQLRA